MRATFAWIFLGCALAAIGSAQQKDKTCGDCTLPSLSGTPGPVSDADARTDELKKLDADVDRLVLAGDEAGVAGLLDDSMVSIDEEGSATPRDKILSRVRPPRASSRVTLVPSEVVVRFFGDTAVVTAKKTRGWEMNGEPNSMSYHEVNTWVRRDGRWKLASSIRTYERPPYAAKDVAFDLSYDGSQALGRKDAPLVIYEFSDYECPFCRRFAHETFSRVEQEYVRSGKAALVFRDNPLDMHPRAMPAALASRCAAAQGKLWAMNERLLQDPVALADADLARNAREIGLDTAAFTRCSQDPATAEKIRRDMKEASKEGVKGTPIFVVAVRKPGEATAHAIRMIEGAQPYEVFQKTLDGLLRARS